MKINEQYLDFYCKRKPCIHLPYKLVNDHWIDAVFSKIHECGSSLSKQSLCIFNPFSLTNIIRTKESSKAYLDESEKTTKSFNDLKSALFSLHDSYAVKCPALKDNLEKTRSVFAAEYPNQDNSIYGLVGFEFTFDTSHHSAEYYAKVIAKKANALNYNVVDYNASYINAAVEYQGKSYTLSKFDIEFEATYQDKINLGISCYVYHVTTKNNAAKILKKGLLPGNSNAYGFKYPSRIYVFVNAAYAFNLAEPYAANSKKENMLFMKGCNADELMKSYKILMTKLGGTVVDSREFTILQIDLSKTGNVKFYRDNTFEIGGNFVAAYTEQAIHPNAISAVYDFTLPYN